VRDADAHGQSSNPQAKAVRQRHAAYIKYCAARELVAFVSPDQRYKHSGAGPWHPTGASLKAIAINCTMRCAVNQSTEFRSHNKHQPNEPMQPIAYTETSEAIF
jgi:hypothetical protein